MIDRKCYTNIRGKKIDQNIKGGDAKVTSSEAHS